MRRYVVAVIFAIWLTIPLFMAIPTRGIPAFGEYDPWADINDDGTINMKDIAYAGRLFMTSGSPAKSVTINGNWTEGGFSFSLAPDEYTQNLTITTGGFKTITISVDASYTGSEIQIFIGYLSGNDIVGRCIENVQTFLYPMILYYPWYNDLWQPIFRQSYEVTSPQMMFCIWNNSTSHGSGGNLYYYLST